VTTGGWPVTLSSTTLSYNGTTFNSGSENQHGALLLVNGILYIPFGGEYGDGGNYNGWIVAIEHHESDAARGMGDAEPAVGHLGIGRPGVRRDVRLRRHRRHDERAAQHVRIPKRSSASPGSPSSPRRGEHLRSHRVAGVGPAGRRPRFRRIDAGVRPAPGRVEPAVAPHRAGEGGALFVLNGADLSTGSYPTPGGSARRHGGLEHDRRVGLHLAHDLHVGLRPSRRDQRRRQRARLPRDRADDQRGDHLDLLTPGGTPIASEAWCAPNSQGGGHLNYPPISTTTDGVSANAIVWFMNGSQLSGGRRRHRRPVVTTTGAACDTSRA
jgi:hypothetical protein